MTFQVRIIGGPEEDVILYDTIMPVLPRPGDTMTLRFPDRNFEQHLVNRVDFLLDAKLSEFKISEDLVNVRVYVRQLSPSRN